MREETEANVARLKELVRQGEAALALRPILEPREVAMLIAQTELDRMRLELALYATREDWDQDRAEDGACA